MAKNKTKNKTKNVVDEKTTTNEVAPEVVAEEVVAEEVVKSFKLDTLLYKDVLKACKQNEAEADKIIQLIADYSFEEDQVERQRCISIAFGNWRHGDQFDATLGDKETFEEHNFNKAQKILKKLMG
jgi:hypothetical protein